MAMRRGQLRAFPPLTWVARALWYVRLTASLFPTLLCEEVRALADAHGFEKPRSNKEWGRVMQMAEDLGVITPFGQARSAVEAARGSQRRLWRSQVYKPKQLASALRAMMVGHG